MTEVISVRFKSNGKIYFFDPNGVTAEKGQPVIVETSKGIEYAECAEGNHEVEDDTVIPPLRPVIRVATEADVNHAEQNKKKEDEAFKICQEKIAKHGLDMKLVDVEYSFEGSKILFFFTSDGRVDFRELVKDLASVFKTRVELRQIGIRDEARMLGGLGICGKPFCCVQFLDDFQPVSIKMAKTQGLSLNPTKISGTCGRLMCCLKYEQEAYEELVKNAPKMDAFVQTPQGKGSVIDVNLLRGRVRVRLEDSADTAVKTFEMSEIEILGGKAKRAEYLALKAEGKGDVPPPRRSFDARASRPRPEAKPKPEPKPESKPESKAEPKPESKAESKPRSETKPRQRPRPEAKPRPEPPVSTEAVPTAASEGERASQKPTHRHRRGHGGKPQGDAQQQPRELSARPEPRERPAQTPAQPGDAAKPPHRHRRGRGGKRPPSADGAAPASGAREPE